VIALRLTWWERAQLALLSAAVTVIAADQVNAAVLAVPAETVDAVLDLLWWIRAAGWWWGIF
jgi:hypothetical protein